MKYILIYVALFYTTLAAQKMEKDKEFVPQWAKKAVWYQIFPERFRNGDTGNDPTLKTLEGAWPHDSISPWKIHPWTSDWYKLQPWEEENGKDIWFNIQRRRYGGDIQGIIDKLDYLKDLGITAIYLNPIFESPSSHKYDGATYHHVDPNFGPDPEFDRKAVLEENPADPSTWIWTKADKLFLKLISEVHKHGMRIIIDGVFNHMGINSWPFRDVINNGPKSKYKDWFTITSWEDPKAGTKFNYEGWFGVRELPELREDKSGIVLGPKRYIFSSTRRWMDPDNDGNPEDGIDGWRLDVAFCVHHEFWKDWRKLVKSIDPEAYLTAEVIDEINIIKPYLMGDEFDAVMNYNYLFACSEFFIDEKNGITPSKFDSLLEELGKAFPKGVSYVQMNLDNSHDTQRLLSHIVNRDKYNTRNWTDSFDKWKGSNHSYNTRKPDRSEIRINRLMAIFKFTFVGAPYIYYGEEAGMWGANDPDCRKPMVWDDLEYESEKYLPDQSLKSAEDKVEFDKELFTYYKELIKIRNNNEVLQTGSFKTVITDDADNIFAFSRYNDSEEILVIINNGSFEKKIELPVAHREFFRDLLKGEIYKTGNGLLNITVPEKQGIILKKDWYR